MSNDDNEEVKLLCDMPPWLARPLLAREELVVPCPLLLLFLLLLLSLLLTLPLPLEVYLAGFKHDEIVEFKSELRCRGMDLRRSTGLVWCCFGWGCSFSSCCIIIEWSSCPPPPPTSLPTTKIPSPRCSLLLGELYNELAVVVAVVKEVSRSFSQHSAAITSLSMMLCCVFGPRELRQYWRWRCLLWRREQALGW